MNNVLKYGQQNKSFERFELIFSQLLNFEEHEYSFNLNVQNRYLFSDNKFLSTFNHRLQIVINQ